MQNTWGKNRDENLRKYYSERDFQTKRFELYQVIRNFNINHINYNLFCSSSLFFSGITSEFDDFDILIDINDINKARDILMTIGYSFRDKGSCEVHGVSQQNQIMGENELRDKVENHNTTSAGDFCSDAYYSFRKNGVQVELISGFLVNLAPPVEPFRQRNYGEYLSVDGMKIPVLPMEVQFVLYSMMLMKQKKRECKTRLLFTYLMEKGLTHPEVLVEFKNKDIPDWIKENIDTLLANDLLKEVDLESKDISETKSFEFSKDLVKRIY